MTRPHEGGEALFDIGGGSNVSHADASILEDFELSSTSGMEELAQTATKLLAEVVMFW
jgi:hypothetical protein